MQTLASYIPLEWLYWPAGVLLIVLAWALWTMVRKSRRLPGEHVFRASRWSRGNHLLPAQVIITRDSITLYKPQWIGKIEGSVHLRHVASIKIDTNIIFSNIFIETTGGHNPLVYAGHTKGDAVRIKAIIEKFQSDRYNAPTERPVNN